MRVPTLMFLFVVVPLAALFTVASAQTPQTAPASGIDIAALNRSADACTDFYQFACGGWMAANPVPADRQRWGRFAELQEKNFVVLRRILETRTGNGDEKKAADYYAACMDEPGIDAKGLAPMAGELAAIDALTRREDLAALVARLHAFGVGVFFRFGADTSLRDATRQIADVDQGGISLPDRDYYLKTDARSLDLLAKYHDAVRQILALGGAAPDAAALGADAVVAIETALARVQLDAVSRRDPANADHPMKRAAFEALAPAFDWAKYFAATGAPRFDRMNVDVPSFIKGLNTILTSTSVNDIKVYLRWHLLRTSAPMLPTALADASFAFFGRALTGQQEQLPRWRRCVAQADAALGEALGKAYVEETFGSQAKEDTLSMVRGIKVQMKSDIDTASWMSPATQKAASSKLQDVIDRIGYPEQWRDYSALRITRDDALGDMQRATAFERQRHLAKVDKPVDRTEWDMTPPTVNAYYAPDKNNINFPAGILQPPFYGPGRDAAANFGGAGAVIGHELTHGFDDEGRKFDGKGNLRDWWKPADAKAYEARASCIANQYSQYVAVDDVHINGKLTLGENTADNGGLRLAFLAYLAGPAAVAQPVLDGFTPDQRFFIGWGQL